MGGKKITERPDFHVQDDEIEPSGNIYIDKSAEVGGI